MEARIRVRREPGSEITPGFPWRAQYPCCPLMNLRDGWSGGWPSWRGVMSQVARHIAMHAEEPTA